MEKIFDCNIKYLFKPFKFGKEPRKIEKNISASDYTLVIGGRLLIEFSKNK